MRTHTLPCLSLLLSFGCVSRTLPTVSPESQRPWREVGVSVMTAERRSFEWPPEQEPLAAELDLGDAGAPDSLIAGLMAHRLAWPAQVAVAVLHLRGPLARQWWGSGESGETSQMLADSAIGAVAQSPRVSRASALPALLVPNWPSVGALRESAARLQAAALLVYRPSCRVYERTPFVGSPQYRAQCTLEVVLLDTRSGVMPFATVVTRERVTQKQRGEFDRSETLRRAQVEAIVSALHEVGSRLGEALRQVPLAEH
jgi:hypothetical protein